MGRWAVVVLLVLLVLVGAMGLRNAVVTNAGISPVLLAGGGAPAPPTPWFGGGAPAPPTPWAGGGAPAPPTPWSR
jgi:hypothetical protein